VPSNTLLNVHTDAKLARGRNAAVMVQSQPRTVQSVRFPVLGMAVKKAEGPSRQGRSR